MSNLIKKQELKPYGYRQTPCYDKSLQKSYKTKISMSKDCKRMAYSKNQEQRFSLRGPSLQEKEQKIYEQVIKEKERAQSLSFLKQDETLF